jgi:hypothetical protein
MEGRANPAMEEMVVCCGCDEEIPESEIHDPYGMMPEPLCLECYCEWFNLD